MEPLFSAFVGTRRLATGPLASVLTAAWPHRQAAGLLFFSHETGRQTDFDWSGTLDDVLARALPSPPKAGRGRPRLGVVSTEVTLLPRHWEWLDAQPARASGTLRRLVEEAMAREAADPKKRLEALGRVLWALAGNEPGFLTPWAYAAAGAPAKTQAVVRRLLTGVFDAGLPGADDLGAMSAWAVWATLGLYPVLPGTDTLALHGPRFPRVVLHTADGTRTLTITGDGAADDAPYVLGTTVNGQALDGTRVRLADLAAATDATLAFRMGKAP